MIRLDSDFIVGNICSPMHWQTIFFIRMKTNAYVIKTKVWYLPYAKDWNTFANANARMVQTMA